MRFILPLLLFCTVLRADIVFPKQQVIKFGNSARGWRIPADFKAGDYYVQFKCISGYRNGTEYECYRIRHNGNIVDAPYAGPYEKYGKGWAFTIQSRNRVHVKPGDVFSWDHELSRQGLSLTFAEKPLTFLPNRIAQLWTPEPIRFSAKKTTFDDVLKVRINNVYGLDVHPKIRVVVKDYYGTVVAEKNTDQLSFDLPYRKTDSSQYKAEIFIKDDIGKNRRQVIRVLKDNPLGVHKVMHLNKGWEIGEVPDDGTLKTRVLQTTHGNLKWRPVTLPAVWKTQAAWFRRTLTIPADFRNARYILHFTLMPYEGAIYVNGKKVCDHTIDRSWAAVAVDITNALKPDSKNLIEVSMLNQIAGLTMKARSRKAWKISDDRIAYNHRTGALSECFLEAVPATYLGKVEIVTSLKDKTITVKPVNQPAKTTITNKVCYLGKEVFSFKGSKGVWKNPILWGPTEFPLLKLETKLLDKNGNVLDTLNTRFGFREITANGMNLVWNGKNVFMQSRALFSSIWYNWMPDFGKRSLAQQSIQNFLESGIRTLRHNGNDTFYNEIADEEGMTLAHSSAVAGPSAQILNEDRFWKNKFSNDEHEVEAYINHPSIFFWYLSNEFYAYSFDKNFERLAPTVRNIQAKDPTRFTEAGCDLDLRGITRHFSTHYPMDYYNWRTENVYLPDMIYWRHLNETFKVGDKVPKGQVKGVCNVHGASMITWGTKPIIVNETGWDVFCSPPNASTRFAGEQAYRGNADLIDVWFRQLRMNSIGQRDAGVCILTPWTHNSQDRPDLICPENEVVIVQKYSSVYQWTRLAFDINIFHGAFKKELLDFYYTVKCNGKTVQSGTTQILFDFSQNARWKLKINADRPGEWTITAGLRGITETTHKFRVEERKPIAKGMIVKANDALNADLLKKVENGATVLIMKRKEMPSWFPVRLEKSNRIAAVNYTFRKDHPFVKGISDAELSYWYPNHKTGSGYYTKPSSGNTMTVIEAGGPEGLVYAGLIDIPCGKGRFVVSALELNPEINPVAARIINNIFTAPKAPQFTKAAVPAGTNEAFLSALKTNGVEFDVLPKNKWNQAKTLIVDGSKKIDVSGFKGNVLVLQPGEGWGLTYSKDLPTIIKSRAWHIHRDDPVLTGVNAYDLYWRQNIQEQGICFYGSQKSIEGSLADKIITSGAVPLCYPEIFARRGNIFFTTFNWNAPEKSVRIRKARLLSTLMTNLCVKMTEIRKRELPQNLKFTPVNISKFLDRTYDDKKSNDGIGGWTDQGPNLDFRNFDLKAGNHKLNGITFRIERPKGCFALSSRYRKGGHAFVTIPVNRKADCVAFLHASAWTGGGTQYVIEFKYADGSVVKHEMKRDTDVRDWGTASPNNAFEENPCTVTKNAYTVKQQVFGLASIFSTVWKNPNPEKEIGSITFRSLKKNVAVILAVSTGTLPVSAAYAPTANVDQKRYTALIAAADKIRKAGNYRKAIAEYEKILEEFPTILETYRPLGDCHEALGDKKGAIEVYRRSLKADINQPDMFDRIKRLENTAGK